MSDAPKSPEKPDSTPAPPKSAPEAPRVDHAQAQSQRDRKVFSWSLVAGGLVLIASFFLSSKLASSLIPKSYALCSREENIYTVDESKPRVQCIVVHRSRILDTEDLGTCAV